jgi:transcriptional regulator with XRE-family HTH domain
MVIERKRPRTSPAGAAMGDPRFERAAFAARLGGAMNAAGRSVEELAGGAEAHPNRVREWLRGTRTPSIPHLVGLATVLDVDMWWLVTGSSARGGVPPAGAEQRTSLARDLAAIAPRLVDLAERARQLESEGA